MPRPLVRRGATGAGPLLPAGRRARRRLDVAEVGGTHGRIAADLLGGAHGDPFTEVEDDHRVRQGQHGGDVVLHDDEREPVVALVDDLPEDGDQVLRTVEVEAGQRLVEQEDLRLAGQRPGHLDQSDHAQGQGSHRGLGHMGQVQQLEQPVDLLGLARRGAEQGRGDRACPATSGGGRPGPGRPARGARGRSAP